MKCTAIVLAAGAGKRMCSTIRKQFLEVSGYPVIYYSLKCFQESPIINDIILVTSADCISYCEKEIVAKYGLSKVKMITAGGKERYDSVYLGLKQCIDTDYVFIHDGARPFITEEILERGMEAVKKADACVIGMPSKDTVKIVDGEKLVEETPQREKVWIIQTPQIFKYSLIMGAYESIRKKDMKSITDDAMVVESETDIKIKMVEGSYKNIKITTPEDLEIAEVFLKIYQ